MVDDKKEKQQRCLRVFNTYFPSCNREDGCIKAIKEDLERIKKITNLEEKGKKAHFYWIKHRDNEIHANSRYSFGNLNKLGISHLDTIEKYRKLIKELWELGIETAKQLNKDKQQTKQRESNKNPLKLNLIPLKKNSTAPPVPPQSPPPTTSTNLNPKINSVQIIA